MNERIKELAVAAAPVNSSIPHSEWNIPKEFIERFAQLIVRECVLISRTSSDGFSAGKQMEEHFGVEE